MPENSITGKRYRIQSDLDLVDGLREEFGLWLSDLGLDDGDVDFWQLVLSESLVNAILHGNQKDPTKQVEVIWFMIDQEVHLEVADSGKGPPETMQVDPALPDDPFDSHGRGLFLIRHFCDRWEHWRSPSGYRQILVKKHRSSDVHEPVDRVLEQALNELTVCYESLAAFYRLGDGLVRSENVSRFMAQAIEDLQKVVSCDFVKLSLTDTLQSQLREEIQGLDHVLDTVTEVGLEARVFQSKEEFVWETYEEIADDQALSGFASGFCCPVQAAGNVQGVIVLARLTNMPYFNSAELNTVRTFADLIGIAVANANNTVVRGREQQAFRELEIASEMQNNLLPMPNVPPGEDWTVFVERKSAREVAGDYVEVCFSKNEDLLYMVTVDVMGKGVSAAFLAAMFRTALHICFTFHYTLDELVMALNRVLCEQIGDLTMFATCSMACFSKEKRTLEVVNAGHCPVLLAAANDELHQIEPSGPPLGIFEDATYGIKRFDLKGGERMIMVTDGLYEWEYKDSIWGWSNFVEFVLENLDDSPEAFWKGLQKEMSQEPSESGKDIADDQTLLYWKLKP